MMRAGGVTSRPAPRGVLDYAQRRVALAAVLTLLLGPLTGCNIVGPLLFFASPPQIQHAELKLSKGRIALLVDFARANDENPVFSRALHEKLTDILREKKVNEDMVSYNDVLKLRRQNPDFAEWSIQRAGRELRAEQVIYLRVEQLKLRPEPDHPIIEPSVIARLKVIGVHELSREARVWPSAKEREGREIRRARAMREPTNAAAIDDEAAKLGRDAAQLVAMPFYDVDTEAAVPWEP